MNREKNIFINKIVERAIKHEAECQCELHVNGRRISDAEVNAVRIIFSTEEGYTLMMGIVSIIVAEIPGVEDQFCKFVYEHRSSPIW